MADDKKPKDLLQITGATDDGKFTYIRQQPGRDTEVGILKIPEEGKAMRSPLSLKAVNDRGLYEVEELMAGTSAPASKGPAKVNSDEFRDGWDRIFGAPKTIGQA